jgi:hypothetical protein
MNGKMEMKCGPIFTMVTGDCVTCWCEAYHSKRKEEMKKETCGQENFNLPLAVMWPYYCHDCDQIQQPTPCPIEGQIPY